MARYDGGWERWGPGGSYDRVYWSPHSPRGEGIGFGNREPAIRWNYDRDYGPGPGGGASGEGLYGPGRYGLGPYHERLRRRRRSDDELKQEVEEALFYDTWVDSEAITVEAREGVVTLRGELPSYDEIRYATDDAWDVDGVLGVRSELTVRER